MMDKTTEFICEAVREIGDMDIEAAEKTVLESWFPDFYKEHQSYVQHYNAEYWAEHILGIREW